LSWCVPYYSILRIGLVRHLNFNLNKKELKLLKEFVK
jgi:hypothetical protein